MTEEVFVNEKVARELRESPELTDCVKVGPFTVRKTTPIVTLFPEEIARLPKSIAPNIREGFGLMDGSGFVRRTLVKSYLAEEAPHA